MKHDKPSRNLIAASVRGSVLLGACALSAPGYAKDFTFGDFELNVDATVSYAAAWRTTSADDDLVARDNFNDGNNNFDSGSLINSNLKGILEVGGVYNNFSFFVRGDANYDYVYVNSSTDLSEANYLTYNNGKPFGGTLDRGEFPEETIDEAGRRIRLLDAFFSYNFNAGDNMGGAVRLGRQVISWGEATFTSGINALQNPLDAVARTTPGAEVREYLLPTAAIDLKWDFTDVFSMEAYYKLKWEETTLPGVGSFWSGQDFLGPGAERFIRGAAPAGTIERRGAVEPDAGDHEYGVAARFVTNSLGGANFDFLYVKANTNVPTAEVNFNLATGDSFYQEVFGTDIDNYGFSFSTNVSEAQVYLDLVYSPNMPFADAAGGAVDLTFIQGGMETGHLGQAVVGFTDGYTAFDWLSEQIFLTAELIYTRNNLGSNKDAFGALYNATAEAWGYRIVGLFNYYKVVPGLDVQVQAFWSQDVSGNGNGFGYQALTDGARVFSLGVVGWYLSNWEMTARYQLLFGGDDRNEVHDRDNFSLVGTYRY